MLRDASQRASGAEAPALASRCDAPQHGGGGKHQPAGVRNDRRGSVIVSGLLFTMTFATHTCRPHCALKILQGNACAGVPSGSAVTIELLVHRAALRRRVARRVSVRLLRGQGNRAGRIQGASWCDSRVQFDSYPRSPAGSLRHGCDLIGVILSWLRATRLHCGRALGFDCRGRRKVL